MPRYSSTSKLRLSTCHRDIQAVFNEVIKHTDCTILEGHRGEEEQNHAFDEGRSQILWPYGSHNSVPSEAVDAVPYPIDWKDRERFTLFAGFVLGVAAQMGIELRWGGDWDRDWKVKDNRFDDLPHFQLVI